MKPTAPSGLLAPTLHLPTRRASRDPAVPRLQGEQDPGPPHGPARACPAPLPSSCPSTTAPPEGASCCSSEEAPRGGAGDPQARGLSSEPAPDCPSPFPLCPPSPDRLLVLLIHFLDECPPWLGCELQREASRPRHDAPGPELCPARGGHPAGHVLSICSSETWGRGAQLTAQAALLTGPAGAAPTPLV